MSTGRTKKVSGSRLQIDEATLIHRGASVVTAMVDEEFVIMNPKNGRCFELDDIGSDIWGRLETAHCLSELIDKLAADYDADRKVIAEEVRGLLSQWAERDMVRFESKVQGAK